MSEHTVIIEIGAEGGSIKVLRHTAGDETAEYSVQLRDQTMTFLSEDEMGPEIRQDSSWTSRWSKVVKTLGRWPWPMLYPMFVHPEYRARVLTALQEYKRADGQVPRATSIERWKEACRPTAST